ncbi:unnamed protein product [Heterobilharzia americana]|nr:unnamed protein product [Heterobilharzia americana]
MLYEYHLVGILTIVSYMSDAAQILKSREHTLQESRIKIGRFCFILGEEKHIFLATNVSIIVISLGNESFIRDQITWPTNLVQSDPSFKKGRCDSVIHSVIQLKPNIFETCGKFAINIRCTVLVRKGLIWTSLHKNIPSYEFSNGDLTYRYSDDYLTLASSSNGYFPRLELNNSSCFMDIKNNNNNSNIYESDHRFLLTDSIHWDKVIETNNLKNSHFTEGVEFTFHKILSLPGRRYIVFREPAIETQLKENPWTSEHKIVYTRIGRICTEDEGFVMPNDGRKLFTTFFKTRLVCQVRTNIHDGDGKYGISSTNRDFNYLVALTTSYSPGIKNDLLLYGLFSARNPQIDDHLPPSLINNLVSTGPLALCIYKLSAVDKIIESSDLIMRLPSFSPSHLRDVMLHNESHLNLNDESNLFGRGTSKCTNGLKRINRDKYPHLKDITRCPGPSSSNKRLALEASLMVDSVYPERLNIVGLIETRSQISVFIIDPRHVSRVYKDTTQPRQIKHIRYTIFYVGTEKGDVFKMLIFNEVEEDFSGYPSTTPSYFLKNNTENGRIPERFTVPYPSSSMISTGNIRVLKQMIASETNERVTNLLFIYNSYLNHTTEILSGEKQFTYSTMDKFSLLVFYETEIIQVEITQCDEAKTCRDCVALKDPDCYWSEILFKCNKDVDGLSNILTGFHSGCKEPDNEKSQKDNDAKSAAYQAVSNLSEVTSNKSSQRKCFNEKQYLPQTVSKYLLSGFIGMIIGLAVGLLLFFIGNQLLRLFKSRSRNLVRVISKNQIEQICNRTNEQHIGSPQRYKQPHNITYLRSGYPAWHNSSSVTMDN